MGGGLWVWVFFMLTGRMGSSVYYLVAFLFGGNWGINIAFSYASELFFFFSTI